MINLSSGYIHREIMCAAPQTIYRAIKTDLGKWWGHMDNKVLEIGDVFKISWGKPWYQFRTVSLIENQTIVWECIDANQIIGNLQGVQKEWVGTTVHWNIKALNVDQVELIFEHKGLSSDLICFDVCSSTWSRFISQELKSYVEGQDK